MSDTRQISIFIASPGDLAVERSAFRKCIDELNDGFGLGAKVEFEALAWEDTLASTGRRSQSVINEEIDRCDVFVLVMHRRWGQAAPDAKPYSSYTEEEFHRALERWKKDQTPEIFVFFKHIDSGQMADPGKQLQPVLDFRRQLEETGTVFYREFAIPGPRDGRAVSDSKSAKDFTRLVERHLQAYVLGELPKSDPRQDIVVLPVDSIRVVEQAQEAARKAAERADALEQKAEAAEARAEEQALQLAKHAAQAALDGHVEEARQTFARVTESTTSLQILFLAYEFFRRTGDLDTAERLCEHRLALSGPEHSSVQAASALNSLGRIYQTRGELDQAEQMHRKSLAIHEELGHKEGMAIQYGNRGLIYRTRGELDQAEQMLCKAFDLFSAIGAVDRAAKMQDILGRLRDG